MTVQFYCLNDNAEPESLGTITLKDGELIATPADSIALRNVLDNDVRVDQGGGEPPLKLNALYYPEAFLKALPKAYVGTYFWATAIED